MTGDRDKALVLTGFHYASRSQDPAGLLAGDVTAHPRGLVVSVLTGKTKHSVRDAKILYASDPEICPIRAWTAYRTRLAAEARWGRGTGGMTPDFITRISARACRCTGISP
ncbi:hypothetical protein [Streptomyces tsukubensis]|uniref:hypothetical protein n=1 Tax=Streptomyces tsukubensis TaxID=83656 RepID=UPI00344E3087